MHPATHAVRRLREEALTRGIALTLQNPQLCRVSWPPVATTPHFDLTLNRIASVEGDAFLETLMRWPVWGRQVNAWEIRQKLWDKSRQALWMSERDWPALPFFVHRGPLTTQDAAWRRFADAHASGKGWVLKMNRGQRGVGVHFLASEGELMGWLETLRRMGDQDFLVQPWLPVEKEYRVTLLGQRVWGVLERKGMGLAANFAQGGEARELTKAHWPVELTSLIQRMTQGPVADLLSIDILMSPETLVVSDINTTPGFEQLEAVTGRNLAADLWAHLIQT